jgi:hypothetical protein
MSARDLDLKSAERLRELWTTGANKGGMQTFALIARMKGKRVVNSALHRS